MTWDFTGTWKKLQRQQDEEQRQTDAGALLPEPEYVPEALWQKASEAAKQALTRIFPKPEGPPVEFKPWEPEEGGPPEYTRRAAASLGRVLQEAARTALMLPKAARVAEPSPAEEAVGTLIGTLAPIGLAARGVRLAGETAARLAPRVAERVAAMPALTRTLAREAGTGAAFWGLQEAAPLRPPEEKPGVGRLLPEMAFFGVGGTAGRAAGEALARTALPEIAKAALRGAAVGGAGLTAAAPLYPAGERPTLRELGTTAGSLALFEALTSALTGRPVPLPERRAEIAEEPAAARVEVPAEPEVRTYEITVPYREGHTKVEITDAELNDYLTRLDYPGEREAISGLLRETAERVAQKLKLQPEVVEQNGVSNTDIVTTVQKKLPKGTTKKEAWRVWGGLLARAFERDSFPRELDFHAARDVTNNIVVPQVRQAIGGVRRVAEAALKVPVVAGTVEAARGKAPAISPAKVPPDQTAHRRSIIRYIEQKLLPVRTGRLRLREALGEYHPWSEVVRTRVAEDLRVIAHEVGHHIDHLLGLRTLPGFENELVPLGQATTRDPARYYEEGIAEFLARWFINPDEARRVAPTFFTAFEARLASEPELAEVLRTVQKDITTWFAQPAAARIAGAISVGERKVRPLTWDRLYSHAVDELRPLERAVKIISGGEQLSPLADPFLRAWLSRGWTGKAETYLWHGVLNESGRKVAPSLAEILGPLRDSMDDFRIWITALRAKELHQRDIETGIDPADADAVVQQYARPEFQEALRKLIQYQDAVLEQTLVREGLLSPEAVEKMRARNVFYVPFYRLFDESGPGTVGFGKGYANIQEAVRRIKGSGRTIIDPLESIIKNTYYYVNLAERNAVGRLLADLAERKEGFGRLIEKVPAKKYAVHFKLKEIEDLLEAAGVDTDAVNLEAVATIFRPTVRPAGKENIVVVWRKGKPELYQLEPELYRAVLMLDKYNVSMLERLLSYPASWLRAGATLSPTFIMRNPLRDQLTAFVNSRYGFIPGVDLLRGLFHAVRKDDLYWQWKNAGGAGATLVSLDRDYLQKDLRKMLRTAITQRLWDTVTHPLEVLRALSEFMEEATRLGEFIRGVAKEGPTPEGLVRAALASRDVTLDFGRTGFTGRHANRLIAFFNAAVQGIDKLQRQFRQDPVGSTLRAVVGITLPSVILYFANRDNPRYRELPQWRKDLFWNIPFAGGQRFISIPKPFELGILFGTLPERILAWIDRQDPRTFEGLTKQIWEVAMPGFLPTIFAPWVEVVANRSLYTGRPIVPEREKRLPPEEQYAPYTSETAKLVGRALGVSPRKVETLVSGYLGGLGRLGLEMADVPVRAVTHPPARPAGKKSTLERALVTEPRGPEASLDRFYDLLNREEAKYRAWQERIKRGQKPPKDVPDMALLRRLRSAERQLQQLRAERRQIEFSRTLTPEQKRRMLETNNRLMELVVRFALPEGR